MDLDWCIRCDKHTKGGLYCSELCQREDYAQTAQAGRPADPLGIPRRPVPTALASPTLGGYHLGGTVPMAGQYPGATFAHGLATPSSSPEHLTPQRPPPPPPLQQHPVVPANASTAAALLRQKILGYGGQEGQPLGTATAAASPASLRPLPAQRSSSTSNIRSAGAYLAGYLPSL
ncbi:hypothetical protein SYNPS1DRAFT_23267 [Syncephalis pseudoplumigaleata]|uniref:Uncharacterized protein n=1 Tax=Syncephalis pseudoplumigaleata TaxID=1712513 RepID=A0A4P9YXL9_9FUNG|nr:hypothetical protein SYNPS1DRAFT_23267 [Syncephalis pseudoplumigaleata]|eukprot:RKP24668.1 hypothetical protein SYNPS1DRAFT_23267 [Syncephalis pseudoplumigaleata]